MNELAHAHSMMTVAEYLTFADAPPRQRFELLAGVPVAMAPANLTHSTICGNINAACRQQVRDRGCRSYQNVGVAQSEDADFMPQPDVLVRCGPVEGLRRCASDPIVVFEVLSPSNMADDRGYKFKGHMQFPTLRHLVLVYQDEIRVEHWSRDAAGEWSEWAETLSSGDAVLALPAIGAELLLSDVYDGVFSA